MEAEPYDPTRRTPEARDAVADAPCAATGWTGWRRRPRGPTCGCRRADRPIGTWLLLLPCWWGVGWRRGRSGQRRLADDLWIVAGCAIGAFLMRGAGCTWNDITDRDIDGSVARTRSRPDPLGAGHGAAGAGWMVAQALVAFTDPALLQPRRHRLGIASLGWWRSIPSPSASPGGRRSSSASRSTGARCWPGRRMRAAGLAAGAAVPGGHRLDAVLRHDLCPSGQAEDDALIGVKSTALLFGDRSRRWLPGSRWRRWR
jgi:4-hydroxybenzoate polyprenyltransferase